MLHHSIYSEFYFRWCRRCQSPLVGSPGQWQGADLVAVKWIYQSLILRQSEVV